MTIAIVCGGRHFSDGDFLFREMDRLQVEHGITVVVEGGQRTYLKRVPIGGADYFAAEWARARDIELHTEEARWDQLDVPGCRPRRRPSGRGWYNANAGFDRNQRMIDLYHPGLVVAFKGRAGTADMCERARANQILVIEVRP